MTRLATLLIASLGAALVGGTARLGQALAPMGIRYVLLVDRPAPEPFSPLEVPPPTGTESALREQLDLTQLPLAPGASLFRVDEAWPLRSDISGLTLPNDGNAKLVAQLAAPPIPAPPAVLGLGPGTSFEGDLVAGASVAQAVTSDPGWTLQTAGGPATRSDLFGWGQRFSVPDAGPATLGWSTPTSSRGLQAVQVVSLLLLLVLVARRRPEPTRRVRNIERPVDFDDLDGRTDRGDLDGRTDRGDLDGRAGRDDLVAGSPADAAVITAEQPVIEPGEPGPIVAPPVDEESS